MNEITLPLTDCDQPHPQFESASTYGMLQMLFTYLLNSNTITASTAATGTTACM